MAFQLYHAPDHFMTHPEFGMGFHIVSIRPQVGQEPEIFILFNHQFLLPIDEVDQVDPALVGIRVEGIENVVITRAPTYPTDLQPCDPSLFSTNPVLRGLTVGPRPLPPGAPLPSPLPYGHLPFSRSTQTDHERFVRFTAFPTDRRVTADGAVLAGTFAAPVSEERMTPSGFAAVGRFALPTLLPAIWRRDIIPPAGTTFLCGAVVPMFGQSGGGVEVKFDNGAPPGSAHVKVARISEF